MISEAFVFFLPSEAQQVIELDEDLAVGRSAGKRGQREVRRGYCAEVHILECVSVAGIEGGSRVRQVSEKKCRVGLLGVGAGDQSVVRQERIVIEDGVERSSWA